VLVPTWILGLGVTMALLPPQTLAVSVGALAVGVVGIPALLVMPRMRQLA
jgi:hypothetical protein